MKPEAWKNAEAAAAAIRTALQHVREAQTMIVDQQRVINLELAKVEAFLSIGKEERGTQ